MSCDAATAPDRSGGPSRERASEERSAKSRARSDPTARLKDSAPREGRVVDAEVEVARSEARGGGIDGAARRDAAARHGVGEPGGEVGRGGPEPGGGPEAVVRTDLRPPAEHRGEGGRHGAEGPRHGRRRPGLDPPVERQARALRPVGAEGQAGAGLRAEGQRRRRAEHGPSGECGGVEGGVQVEPQRQRHEPRAVADAAQEQADEVEAFRRCDVRGGGGHREVIDVEHRAVEAQAHPRGCGTGGVGGGAVARGDQGAQVCARPELDFGRLGAVAVGRKLRDAPPRHGGGRAVELHLPGQGRGAVETRPEPARAGRRCAVEVEAGAMAGAVEVQLQPETAVVDRAGAEAERHGADPARRLERTAQARRLAVEIDARQRRVPPVGEGQVERAVAKGEMVEGDAVGGARRGQAEAEAAVPRLHEVELRADQGGVDDLHLPAHQGRQRQLGVEGSGAQPGPAAGAVPDRDVAEVEHRLGDELEVDRPRHGDGRAGGCGQPALDEGAMAVPVDEIGTDQGRGQHADQQDGQDGQAVAQGRRGDRGSEATSRHGARDPQAIPKRGAWEHRPDGVGRGARAGWRTTPTPALRACGLRASWL